ASIWLVAAIRYTSSSAAANSSMRERPRRGFPMCQSAVCRKRKSVPAGEALEHLGLGRGPLVHLALAGGPRGKREAHEQGDRDLGLLHDHGPGLEDARAGPAGRGQEAVLGLLGLGEVQP